MKHKNKYPCRFPKKKKCCKKYLKPQIIHTLEDNCKVEKIKPRFKCRLVCEETNYDEIRKQELKEASRPKTFIYYPKPPPPRKPICINKTFCFEENDQCHKPVYEECHKPVYEECHKPVYEECHKPVYEECHKPVYEECHKGDDYIDF
jgi:hypothetical protein